MAVAPPTVSVGELAGWRQQGDAIVVLDVRQPWELELARLDGALAMPMDVVTARLDEIPRDRPVVVMCHHGGRSAAVTDFLRRSGYDNVSNLEGGIDAWAREIDPSVRTY